MSDTTKLTAELPKFKDKVMYVSSAISDTKLETSYVVSSSFKGIVRLSPNNHTIVREDATHQLSVLDENSGKLLYSDAIVFDNDSLSAVKSDCDITKRMIIASESSGYLVNFRISDLDVLFDNLGVIGITRADSLAIYSSTTNTLNPDTLFLNDSRILTLAKSATPSVEKLHKSELSLFGELRDLNDLPTELLWGLGDYDLRQVKVIDDADKSYLVYGTIDSDGKRFFRYKQTKLFVTDLIIEALLSLQTIPTGSIHFVPVTIEQYKALAHAKENNGQEYNQMPNVNYINGTPKGITTDPLIRDFLLCDGRLYRTKDFPELAKILWGLKIQTWLKCANLPLYVYPSEYDKIIKYNDYLQQDGTKTFRVPDLRHMFIGAVQALGQYDMNTSTIQDAHINVKAQGTGTYFPDNLPKYSRHYKADNHRHFAAVGTYSGTLYSSDETFHTSSIHDYIVKNNNKTLKLDVTIPGNNPYAPKEDNVLGSNTMVGTMYLTNHPYWMGNKAFNGFSTRIKSIPQRNHIGVDSIPAHYFAAIPMNNKQGTKSDNLDAYSIGTPQTTTQLFTGRTSDCILSVWKDENNKTDTLHGHENSPKFFAMLPLIKI